jgi:hypothetical protein
MSPQPEFSTRCCGELHLTVLSSQRMENSTAYSESGKPSTERGQLQVKVAGLVEEQIRSPLHARFFFPSPGDSSERGNGVNAFTGATATPPRAGSLPSIPQPDF